MFLGRFFQDKRYQSTFHIHIKKIKKKINPPFSPSPQEYESIHFFFHSHTPDQICVCFSKKEEQPISTKLIILILFFCCLFSTKNEFEMSEEEEEEEESVRTIL